MKAGSIITNLLEDRGMKKQDLAMQIGIAPGSLSRLLSGNRGLSAYMCVKIADKLDIPAEILYGAQAREQLRLARDKYDRLKS